MRPKYSRVRARSANGGSGTAGLSLVVEACFLAEEDILVSQCQSNASAQIDEDERDREHLVLLGFVAAVRRCGTTVDRVSAKAGPPS